MMVKCINFQIDNLKIVMSETVMLKNLENR